MENGHDNQGIGSELGFEGVERVIEHAERICEFEQQRIALSNEPGINALRVQLVLWANQERNLTEQRRQAPPPGDLRSRRRRARYSWAVALILSVASLFFSLMAFEPFRLGWKSALYCLGIAIVAPFCTEKFLLSWGNESLVKSLASIAFLAAISSLVLLAAIRGDVLMQQINDTSSAVVFGDDNSTPAQPRNTFYDETVVLLRLTMILLAVAMELAAGLALHDARRLGAESAADPDKLSSALEDVHQKMVSGVFELTKLKNEPAVFRAQFYRDFYRAIIVRVIGKALSKLFLCALGALLLVPCRARAADHVNLVVLVDLTKSVAVQGHDGKTECQKNFEAVTKLLTQVPAGSHVAIVGITDESFSQPYILLSADIGDDEGYFKERLAGAHQQLVQAWQKRSEHLEASFRRTDVLGALFLASQLFQQLPKGRRNVLVIFSDMRQNTKDLNLEPPATLVSRSALSTAQHSAMISNLKDVVVYILAADNAGEQLAYWRQLRDFWQRYFIDAGARLADYSLLRDLLLLEP